MGPAREDDHSSPPKQKAWSCTSTLPYTVISCTETTWPHLCVCVCVCVCVFHLENTEIQTDCLLTNWTHKTAAPYGHRSCTKALFNLSNSTTNTVCPFAGYSALSSAVAVNPKNTAGKQMTAISPDWLTDRSVHDLYSTGARLAGLQGRFY